MTFSEIMARDLAALGIHPGDTVLMHSSMKALGIKETPEQFLSAFCDYLGTDGTLLLPALSYGTVGRNQPLFSIAETPACIGLLPNTFLHMDGVLRSMHPTHSVCARGHLAEKLTREHFLDDTPVGPHSPFRLLPSVGGKILMVGNINEHCTFMHGMEEIAGAPYCLEKEKTRYILRDYDGEEREVFQYHHDFHDIAAQRYERFDLVLKSPEVIHGKLFSADSTCIDAAALEKAAVKKMKEEPYFFVDRK
ncbi:MAG: AAC(3) family N-acetyltransferase [Clostridia bacterium]|nr:AAC(3) family N-acetyltransferase [Clostridia bacterium]